ncbi:uncharacterized protein EV422DRAFT_178602 [Fimicolochytrium jonesii]|uniref:uncharacterized protein n=1 Tax=Fimicolochytrium jonesii TaxID=1396493 RepID=UPI0022FE29C2|nr:uncharacterized protein EV422DRAFT_178602 [Fimicolochytrium jonesii]KAI8818297.1 hypothetical protein EV422DRAFT_178602 [Fimicolochytrium jonesii]
MQNGAWGSLVSLVTIPTFHSAFHPSPHGTELHFWTFWTIRDPISRIALCLNAQLRPLSPRRWHPPISKPCPEGGYVIVANRRTKPATLAKKYPGCTIVDVTSKGPPPWQKFSPLFPHGNIPVPPRPGQTGTSVEGICCEGLRRRRHGRQPAHKTDMKGMKREKSSKSGRVLGHAEKVSPTASRPRLGYLEARQRIYLPAYYNA